MESSIELEHPLVLVVNDKIRDVSEILPVMELVKQSNMPLVLFSHDLQEDPASTMIYNNMKGII